MASFGPNGADAIVNGTITDADISNSANTLFQWVASASSSDGSALNDIAGTAFYPKTGAFSVGRPGYSSGGFCIDTQSSVGTYQFASGYAASMYRRNCTDNNGNWSSWRQVD